MAYQEPASQNLTQTYGHVNFGDPSTTQELRRVEPSRVIKRLELKDIPTY